MSRLGELLVNENLISRVQLDEALTDQKGNGDRLVSCLIKMGYVDELSLSSVLSRQYGVPSIDLAFFEMDPEIIKVLTREVAFRYQVIPVSLADSVLSVAMSEPNNVVVLNELQFLTGWTIEPLVAPESQIREALDRCYGTSQRRSGLLKIMDGLTTIEEMLQETVT